MEASAVPPQIHPECLHWMQQLGAAAAAVPPAELSIEKRRALLLDTNRHLAPPWATLPVAKQAIAIDLAQRTLPARHYQPLEPRADRSASDVLLVFFHGGGWVIGDLDTHDAACDYLAHHLGCQVLSVAYRKAPEHPFPLPCDDASDAYAWAAAALPRFGCQRIALAGDSAGGHLAAHAMFANPAINTAAALLLYPVTDIDFQRPSYLRRQTGPGLTASTMQWFWQQFIGYANIREDSRAVLMRQAWHQRPPPTVIAVAYHDPLHDEGIAYGQLLQRAGATVHLLDAPDMLHNFLRLCYVCPPAQKHLDAALGKLHDFLAVPAP